MKDKDKEKEKVQEKPVESVNDTEEENKNAPPTVEERMNIIQAELENVKDKYLRALAEMENYKKRNTEELKKERKYASMPIADKLIDQLEVFEQALNIKTDDQNFKNFLYGFRMIKDMIYNVLTEEGVALIKLSIGSRFDPNTMQSIETVNKPDQPDNTVIKIVKNGYMYKERLLRPAMVVINMRPEEIKEANNQNENLDANVA
jgi:molecular chaperone GrpE